MEIHFKECQLIHSGQLNPSQTGGKHTKICCYVDGVDVDRSSSPGHARDVYQILRAVREFVQCQRDLCTWYSF